MVQQLMTFVDDSLEQLRMFFGPLPGYPERARYTVCSKQLENFHRKPGALACVEREGHLEAARFTTIDDL